MKQFIISFFAMFLISIQIISFPEMSFAFKGKDPGIQYIYDGSGNVTQARFTPNNIHTWVWNNGIFNLNPLLNNFPGFEWPAGENKYAIFSNGLTIAGYVNGELRMASASYTGEYLSGKVIYVNGDPVGYTDSTFKIYKVSAGDNCSNNPDWANWGLMVPYGAPYTDVNSNQQYDPCIDIPGVKDAEQTIYVYMTDAFPEQHISNEGFGGGTAPLNAELGMTMWGYQGYAVNDIQYIEWKIINKNLVKWDSVFIGISSDPDLGDATDDYIGCDTSLNLAYAYNADNDDWTGNPNTYGVNPPAVGYQIIKGPEINSQNIGISSVNYYVNSGANQTICERDPNTPIKAYNYLKGLKSDGTPWLDPTTTPPTKTKFCFSGDPETETGWTESFGKIANCGGDTTGSIVTSPAGDRRMTVSFGSKELSINPGDTQIIAASQLIARGNSNLNSVTELKLLAHICEELYASGFINVGINPVSGTIPDKYALTQNYPNPFNPSTKIGFQIPSSGLVKIRVYDITGREVAILVNENLKAGSYAVDFDGSKLSSGMYIYTLETDSHRESKKMILLK